MRRRKYDRALRVEPPLVAAMRYYAGLTAWLEAYQAELKKAALATYRDPLKRAEGAPGGMPRKRTDARLPRLPTVRVPEVPIAVIDRVADDVTAHVDKGLRRVYDAAGKFLGRRIPDAPEPRRVRTISLRAATPRVSEQLSTFRADNVALIKSIPEQLHAEVQDALDDAWGKGLHASELGPIIAERFEVSDSRAQLIARDQTLKLNANVTRARHEALGITRYTWSTAGDERVRDGDKGEGDHASLDGTEQSYDDPPDTGGGEGPNNPGEAIGCRCVGIPILPTFDDLEDTEGVS